MSSSSLEADFVRLARFYFVFKLIFPDFCQILSCVLFSLVKSTDNTTDCGRVAGLNDMLTDRQWMLYFLNKTSRRARCRWRGLCPFLV